MDDYLAKPFKRSALLAVLRRWVAYVPRPQVAESQLPPLAAPVAGAGNDSGNAASLPADFNSAVFQSALPEGMGVNSPLGRKLTRVFVTESAKFIAEIERAGASGDTQALSRAAHSLKSSGASVGALMVSGIAKEIELLVRAGKTQALAAHAARLRVAYERYCAAPEIRDMLATESARRNAA